MKALVEPRVVSSVEQSITSPALAVDLDGTLVKTDLLLECSGPHFLDTKTVFA